MKFFLAIAALAAVVLVVQAGLTEEQILKLKTYHKDCIAETGITNEIVERARKGEFSDDIKLKEHLFCVGKKIGFIDEAGHIQKDVLLAKLGPIINDAAVAQKLIDECAVERESAQETAFETVKCYHLKTPTHISIV